MLQATKRMAEIQTQDESATASLVPQDQMQMLVEQAVYLANLGQLHDLLDPRLGKIPEETQEMAAQELSRLSQQAETEVRRALSLYGGQRIAGLAQIVADESTDKNQLWLADRQLKQLKHEVRGVVWAGLV